MADYSRDDADYAERVMQRLMNREADGLELERDVVVSDIEADTAEFSEQLAFLGDFGANMPAVLVGNERVPVSLSIVAGGFSRWPWPSKFAPTRFWRRDPFFYEYMHDSLQALRGERESDGFTLMDRGEAQSTFMRRAIDFLASRVAAVRGVRNAEGRQRWHGLAFLNLRQRLGGPQVATPGCQFTVTTDSGGLRVFWSGAYWVSSNYFNHPTSPTSSVLQSGTYIFGVDGGAYGNNIQWDKNAVVSLPGQPHAHLKY